MRKYWGTVVGIVISLAALAFAVKGIPPAELGKALSGANYWFVIPAALVLFLAFVTRAIRWRGLLRAQVPLGEVFHALNAGYLLNNTLPLRLGELGRAYLLSRSKTVGGAEALSTIIIERLLDLLMTAVILAITLPLVAAAAWVQSAGLTVGAMGIVGFAALVIFAHHRSRLLALGNRGIGRLPRLNTLLARWLVRADSFLSGLEILRDFRQLAIAIFWSLITWTCSAIVSWLLLCSFIPRPSFVVALFALGVGALGYAVPSSPGQAGVYEAAIVAALVPLGVARSSAFSYAVVVHVLNYALVGLLGGWALSQYGETLAGLARSAQTFLAKAPGEAAADSLNRQDAKPAK
ncbi:MAG: flippase-like domain-containing protein [Chloroflexi bacterium]|nr:flippase-like domain-containing protein [Chloroflexota bacterium]